MVQQVYFEFIPGIQDTFNLVIFLYLTKIWLRRAPSFIYPAIPTLSKTNTAQHSYRS